MTHASNTTIAAPSRPQSEPSSAPESESLTLEEALTLHRVTDRAWQVCDSRRTPHEPGYLLGFVESVGDQVELMQLGEKFIWTGFPSMHAALAHVAATAYRTATERAAGDLAWIG